MGLEVFFLSAKYNKTPKIMLAQATTFKSRKKSSKKLKTKKPTIIAGRVAKIILNMIQT